VLEIGGAGGVKLGLQKGEVKPRTQVTAKGPGSCMTISREWTCSRERGNTVEELRESRGGSNGGGTLRKPLLQSQERFTGSERESKMKQDLQSRPEPNAKNWGRGRDWRKKKAEGRDS